MVKGKEKMDKTCFLIGFMGAGKTFLGARLALRLGVAFVDLDDRIAQGEGLPVEAIFNQQGEGEFRRLERRYLRELGDAPPCVVATGGGTPCFFDNMDWMNAHGTTVFLNPPLDVLVARLRTDPAVRPLLAGVPADRLENHISHLLELRAPFYHQAQVIFERTEGAGFLEELADAIIRT